MMKYRLLGWGVLLLGALPYGLHWQYLLHARRTSPLDRWDWLFEAAALLLIVGGWHWWKRWRGNWDWRALFIVAAGGAVLLAGWYRNITTVYLAGALILASGTAGVVWGMRCWTGLLPITGLLLLALPSSSYWCEYFLKGADIPWLSERLTGLQSKLLPAAVLTGWFVWMGPGRIPPLYRLWYPAATLLLAVLLLLGTRKAEYGLPLKLNMESNKSGPWLGAVELPGEAELSFFGDNRLVKKIFFNNSQVLYCVAVEVGSDIHSIHPVELCLRGSGALVGIGAEYMVSTRYGDIAVQELTVRIRSRLWLLYSWYVGPKNSSGNFLSFRRRWRPGTNWVGYQLMTPMPDDRDEARVRLGNFLDHFLSPPVAAVTQP